MLESLASAVLAVNLLVVPSQSSASAPRWESDYGRALANTRTAQKPLLIVLDSPRDALHRIEPVRSVKEHSAGKIATTLLQPYELCHVDVSTEYGQRVAKAFKVQALPYMAIIDKTGRKILYSKSGPITDTTWQTALVTHAHGEVAPAAPVSYLSSPPQQGFYDPSSCPSCQFRW